MNTGDKLAKLRKENNYTQEQLAEILGVSRQSISKWESGIMYPETDKLIRMSELFGCSLDYLLRDSEEEKTKEGATPEEKEEAQSLSLLSGLFRERKSKTMVLGMPLWHIGKNARGFFAVGMKARGVFALGLRATGIFSMGLLSIGVISVGLVSLGLLASGVLAIGAFAAGAISAGIIAIGAIAFGMVSMGAISTGGFAIGALATGKYFAIGDKARAMIAIGDTSASGKVYETIRYIHGLDAEKVRALLDEIVPKWLSWAKEIAKQFL